MAATPKRVDVEPRTAPVQSRMRVSLLAQDAQTAQVLLVKDRGPFLMSPRNFLSGQVFKTGIHYLLITGVIHDAADPAGITLLVSTMKDGLTHG